MIKYDFKIIRDEGIEKTTIVPKLPTELPSLVSIEGPNSTGKSTLLHLIALGCGGRTQPNLYHDLKGKLNSLAESKHQEVEFKVEIDLADGEKLLLEKQKGNSSDIRSSITENGKRKLLSVEEFRKRYSLIYDIPQNPIGRVKDLTKDLSYENNRLANKLRQLEGAVSKNLEDISNGKNPKRIQEVKKEIERLKADKAGHKEAIERLTEEHRQFKIFCCTKNCLDLGEEVASLNKKIKALEGTVKDKKREHRQVDETIREVGTLARAKLARIDEIIAALAPKLRQVVPSGKQILTNWESGSDWKEALYKGEDNDGLDTGAGLFIRETNKFKDKYADPQKVEEAEFLAALINTLENYQGYKVVVPGVNTGIKQFIQLLKEKQKGCGEYGKVAVNCDVIIENLNELLAIRREFRDEISPQIKALTKKGGNIDAEPDDGPDPKEIIVGLKKRLHDTETKRSKFVQDCKDMEIAEKNIYEIAKAYWRYPEYKRLVSYSEAECARLLGDKYTSITEAMAKESVADSNIRQREQELRRLEAQESHKYQDYEDELTNLHQHVTRLRQLIDLKCKKYLEDVLDEKRPEGKDPERETFLDQLWRYLGKRIEKILHADKEYLLEKADITEKVFYTKEKRIIHFDDMGTGQQQSAYLKALLTTPDKRKMIALFDEVAMMDSHSIKPILETMQKLYNSGRLVAGIIVQKADKVKVGAL